MLTRKDFLKSIGHFCTMVDGSKGFICKTGMGNPRVLHNLPEKYYGWPYDETATDDDALESFKKKFNRAWNICDEGDAKCSGVKKILKKCIDLDSKKTTKVKKTTKSKKTKQRFLTVDEIKAGSGHLCKLSDDAKIIGVVEILGSPKDKKSVLDMTVKELLEKLDEIIKC